MTIVKAIPKGLHTLTPEIIVRDASKAIEFYKNAFNAKVNRIHYGPDNRSVIHAELKIGDSILMLNDEFPEMNALSPLSIGGTSTTINIYCEDVDELFNRAVSAGATVTMPLMDQFWGDRYGKLKDPFGHQWSLAKRLKNLSDEEMIEAGKAAFAEMGK
ncbi:MAG: VOC family protein [Candidatus Methanoperedens sp.]|nr:VOC family protein [Candidatus Methanoperedens sp.]